MKKNIILALVLTFSISSYSQNACCSKTSITEMNNVLTEDNKFIQTHQDPTPFKLMEPIGKDVSFKTSDGKQGHAYEIKSAIPTSNYVFVIHEWWGLNDYIKLESEKIFNALGNVNVLALDLYDNNIATSKDSAAKYMQNVKPDRAEAIIKGALTYAGKNAKIATIGWCFGGGWSLQASIIAGKQSKACVMYYGMPEEKTERLTQLKAPVYFVTAEQDQWINQDVVSKFEKNMKTLKKSLTLKSYNADHAFANPSNPHFEKAFSEDAFANSIGFIKSKLK